MGRFFRDSKRPGVIRAAILGKKGRKPNFVPMKPGDKLVAVKLLHTAIWLFFNIVIGYMLWAVIRDRLDRWFWLGWVLILCEALTLWAFRFYCPLTVWARRYSDSARANFDIYLPEWLARNNQRIYTAIMVVIGVLTLVRL